MKLYRIKFGNGRYALWSDMDPEWFAGGPGAVMASMSDSLEFSTPSKSNVDEKANLLKESYAAAGLPTPELWISEFDELREVGLRRHGDDEGLALKPVSPG